MYNVGFGDAFLVVIPGSAGDKRILFDCGSIAAAPGVEMKKVVARIVSDVTDADGVPRIDVIVATHRHKDHVSGFAQAAWQDVEVKEVWMPWTEHPTDLQAQAIREVQSKLALGLDASLTMQAATVTVAAKKKELTRYQDLVSNALMLSNEKSMHTLHHGFSGSPSRHFLPEKSGRTRTFETPALPGMKIHVMGPSRSRDIIRDMDPPAGKSFLRMRDSLSLQTGTPPAPFPEEFRRNVAPEGAPLSEDDEAEVRRAGSLSDLAVAVALDKAVNGTSLMLMLEVAGVYLLFPGDAQWGTWRAAMEDPEWRQLLTRTAFYKIGHHGSHNATPKDFVEDILGENICAMASTMERDIWPEIPRMPLLDGLAKKATIARSDDETHAPADFLRHAGIVEARIKL
jgi:beta-lactamase superfamily II metal-dependent hydrolase